MNLDRNYVMNQCQKNNDINEYLMSIYNIPVQLNAQTIVELGAGESTFALTAAANKTGGQFYSIDIGRGAVERFTPDGISILANEPRYYFIEGDTRVLGKTWDKMADFIFHDTSHVYDQTKIELDLWPKFVRKGGVYMMHDTGHEAGDGMGCRQALNEWYDLHKKEWAIVHLMDTKVLGASVLIKL